MGIQESGEMYLETIHILTERMANVRSIDVVKEMGLSKPSVSRAVNKLKDDGLLDIDNSGFLALTPAGDAIARKIYERHQIITEMFIKMGISKKTAEEDACKIEHVISDETFQKLKEHLRKQ